MDIAQATVRVVADTSQAEQGLNRINQALTQLTPGASTAGKVLNRLSGGLFQLIQGISANAFRTVSSGLTGIANAGVEAAKSLDSARVGLEVLVGDTEDVSALLQDIQKNAVTTPFDISGLAKATQQLAMVTQNGAEAERTVLNLGKAIAAGGGGNAELNRLVANLQEIGLNAHITARDIRQFGTASVPIIEMVADTVGIETNKVSDYLKDVANPYDVLVEAINRAGEEGGRFANMYTASMMTMGQVTENLSDAFSIFSRNVGESSGLFTRLKEAMMGISTSLLDSTTIGTFAESIRKLTENFDLFDIATGAIRRLVQILGAFNAGQFDNIFVFFRELFDTLKQSSLVQTFANAFKVIVDLFSNNHTSEEVRKVAHELGVLIRSLIELKFALSFASYFVNLFSTIGNAALSATQLMGSLVGVISNAPWVGVALGVSAIVAAFIKLGGLDWVKNLFSNISEQAATLGRTLMNFFANIPALATTAFRAMVSGVQSSFQGVVGQVASWVSQIARAISEFASGNNLFTTGYNVVIGLWNGMVSAAKAVINWVVDLGRRIVNAFKSALGIHSPSAVMRDEVGKPIDEGIAEGIRQNYGTVIDAAEEVLEKLVDLQKEWVDEVADLGALDLVQQVKVYKDFAALYQQGSKARLEMDARVHEAEMAINKEIIRLTEDFNTQFTKSVKNAKEFYNVFEYTQGVIARTTSSVIEGMNRQNANMLQYLRNLRKINTMGFDSDFLKEVMDQGMGAAGEVAGLAEATEDEIEEINRLWRERGQIATDIAVENTKDLRQETLEQIDYLQSGLEQKVVTVTDTGTLLVDNFTVGIYEGMPKIADAIEQVMASASSKAKSSADGVGDAFEEIGDAAGLAAGGIDDFVSALDELDIAKFEFNGLQDVIKNLLDKVPWQAWAVAAGGAVLTIIPKVKQLKDTFESFKKPIDTVTTLTKRFSDAGEEVVEKVTTTTDKGVKTVTKSILDGEYEMVKSVSSTGKDITKVSQGIAGDVGETFKSGAAKTVNDVNKAVKDGSGKVSNTVANAASRTERSVADTANKASSSVSRSADLSYRNTLSSTSKIGNAIRKPFQILNTLLDNLTSVIENALTSVGRVIRRGIRVILDIVNEALKGILKLVQTVFEGIGSAIQKLLNKLADPKLLIGVGVLAALATTLLILGAALTVFNGVEWESLAKGAVALAGLAVIAGVMGNFAPQIIAGSVAIGALGVAIAVFGAGLGAALWLITEGLKVAADNLAQIGEVVQNINEVALVGFLGVMAKVSAILTSIVALTAFGAVGSICSAIIGGGLLFAAKSLVEVGLWVQQIDLESIRHLSEIIAAVTKILGEINPWEAFVGVINTILSDVISGGLLLAAMALKEASQRGNEIDEAGLERLGEMVKKADEVMASISPWDALKGVISTICSDVISGGLLVAALALKETSVAGQEIDDAGLFLLEGHVKTADTIMASIRPWDALKGVLSTIATDVISGGLSLAAGFLRDASLKGKEIDSVGITKINNSIVVLRDYIIPHLKALSGWDAGVAAAKLSGARKVIAELVPLSEEMARVQNVGDAQNNIKAVVDALNVDLASIPPVLQNYNNTFYAQGQAWGQSLIEGWETQNGNFAVMGNRAQYAVWQAIESKMPDEFQQGSWLAVQIINGIRSRIPEFIPLGAQVQGSFWLGLENKMPDEYYQGRTLAGKVLEGVHAVQNEGGFYLAGAQVSEGFANGISSTVYRVNAAVGSLSSAAISKLKDLLGIASPSKVFADLGAFVAEGFAEGIEDNLSAVISTGEALAKAVMSGYNDTITPLTATVNRAQAYGETGTRPRGTMEPMRYADSGSIVINQTNNVYDEMDTSKIINDLTWAISRS